ncbi:aldo/keto reductase [Microbacterium oleivorans]|uniref:Aldo/keto reductase n=1 Tax=Microbacterium oleivorans TaxID=273677 RepID=A0A7D5EV93_9MICO|nr:aldo/keto reductase [Microbacterium oleivorans]QLD11211.1 aldo/keto reductase [Microbacterium oleivorans]
MKYTRLGRAGAVVSRIALGTMNMGPVIDEEESFSILDEAFERGVTFLDTADVYGGSPWGDEPGQTEALVGRWFESRGRRDDMVLATKVYGTMGDGRNDRGLSSVHIRAAVENSLRRLQTDRIDLYQMHHIDRHVQVDEVLDAFTRLRDQGKILYLGSSNFAGWHIAQYREVAAATGQTPLVTEQSLYNLAQRSVELEVAPAAESYGMGLLPWSPLAGGELAGILRKSDTSRSDASRLSPERTAQIREYERFADERGIDPATLGIAWLLHQPVVTAPIVGPRRRGHMLSALDAVDVELSGDDLAALDRMWPGPGAPAPEAYAW